MEELAKNGGEIGKASMMAGMDEKTGRKYRDGGKLPSEMEKVRNWKTRKDPFENDWPEIVAKLVDAPELEAKTLFEDLVERWPDKFEPAQLRTLQRRISKWRAEEGPDKEVFFAQEHRPGEAMQTDFTWCTELEVTIKGELFKHMLCHPVLPYSNWEWATICHSESMAAIKIGVQAALFRLGRHPKFHQTDNSTAATHALNHDPENSGKREFNEEYKKMMEYFGMTPRTIEVGKSEQNGDVEALNGSLKRRLKQHLLMRGSRDFESKEKYEEWLEKVLEKANRLRAKRTAKELEAMEPMKVERLVEWKEEDVHVTCWSTIRVGFNSYSVPSRLSGEYVRVRIYEDRLEVYHGGHLQLSVERLSGTNGHRIDYRHIIWSLVQKPNAFARYHYREDLFPSLIFRKTYDALLGTEGERVADREYLRILHLAASTMESEVEIALELLLAAGGLKNADQVKALVKPAKTEVPAIAVPEVNLSSYDTLLVGGQEVAS